MPLAGCCWRCGSELEKPGTSLFNLCCDCLKYAWDVVFDVPGSPAPATGSEVAFDRCNEGTTHPHPDTVYLDTNHEGLITTASKPIDPTDPTFHGKPLWVVYGAKWAPSIMCVKLLAYTDDLELLPIGQAGNVVIWGYSVYRGVPGFRTLGQSLSRWSTCDEHGPRFFQDKEQALDELRRVLTPRTTE